MGRCENKTILVTGAASGIGAAASRLLAGEGAKVMLADVDGDAAGKIAGEIGGSAASTAIDVTSQVSWNEAVATTIDVLGGWNVLVNCAGILRRGTIEDTPYDMWHDVIDVNLTGTWRGCRLAVEHMGQHGGGGIINMSSVSGMIGDSELCAYDASKGGVRLLTKSIAHYCTENEIGVRCNSIHPGVIQTPMVRNYIAEAEDPETEQMHWDSFSPPGIKGMAEDVGNLILFLAGDESRHINGTELVIDGGALAS
ncbi:MAG: SDR family oxidoreductase [Rhodospirillaceae bacterium]|nr:SDR family oxidoreductase [Rhodospirillaceae bacterium]MBT6511256.1 SDR family oxidoreductase [Rhodospirillaceae bacterium]MBT7614975.1 SDR family oxidoreductase [Rhodospirillaceae bacterium]